MKYFYILLFFFFSTVAILAQESITIGNNTEMEKLYKKKAYSEIIDLLKDKDSNNLTIRELYILSKSFAREEQFGNGLAYANKLIDICIKNKDTTNLVFGYNRKVENLLDLNRIDEAYEFCEAITPVFREKDSIAFQKLCFKQGIIYKIKGEYQKAYDTYNKITNKKYRSLGLFTNNYAVILESLNKYDEAIALYKNAIQRSKINNSNILGIGYANVANLLTKMGYLKQAETYLDSAENSITKNTSLRTQKIIYEKCYEYYEGTKNTFYASIYLEQMNQTNEQIFNEKLDTELQALKTSYEREAKLNNQLETSKKEKLYGTIILLFVILLLTSILFVLKYRNVKSAHKSVLTEQKLLRSQMTPHFIFNSLSVLQGMILNDEKQKSIKYLSKFSKLLRLILENSREKLVPLNEELEAIQNYVDLHNMRSAINFKYTLTLGKNINDLEMLIPPMLIQPFIENAIEHGFEKNYDGAEINMDIQFTQNKLICTITDNGVGLNKKSKTTPSKKSLSTQITKERLTLMSKEYKVQTGLTIIDRSELNEKGTQITLTLPYKIE